MTKRLLALALTALALAAVTAGSASAGKDSPDELLAQYQPVTVLDQTERFAPIAVEAFLAEADLERLGDAGYETAEMPRHGLPTHGNGWRLNHRSCSPAGGLAAFACYAGGPVTAPAVYGRHEKRDGMIVLQYWYLYEYNFWSLQYPASDLVWQAHEADWEVVTIVLDRERNPVEAGYSQHCGGERRPWATVSKVPGSDHPLVFVGTGSHANLFAPGTHPIDLACYPPQAVAFFQAFGVTPLDVNIPGRMLGPETTAIERIRDREPRWLRFPGTWGETQYVHAPAPLGTVPFGTSPVGPGFQDEWDDPLGTIAGYRAG
jgi:hypothetical protein